MYLGFDETTAGEGVLLACRPFPMASGVPEKSVQRTPKQLVANQDGMAIIDDNIRSDNVMAIHTKLILC